MLRKLIRLRRFSPEEVKNLSELILLRHVTRISKNSIILIMRFLLTRPLDFLLITLYQCLFDVCGSAKPAASFLSPFGLDMLQVLHLSRYNYENAYLMRELCVAREVTMQFLVKSGEARYYRKQASAFIELYAMSMLAQPELVARYEKCAKTAFEKSFQISTPAPLDPAGLDFHEYIAGKSIALVGPSPPENSSNQSNIIDSHDVVVRLNDPCFYALNGTLGRRTNIAFFNGQKAEKFLVSSQLVPDDLLFVVFKSESQAHRFRKRQNCQSRVCIFPFNSYRSHYNMVQVTILDLLAFGPSIINLYGVNLWLNPAKIAGYQSQSGAQCNWLSPDREVLPGGSPALSPEDRNRITNDFIQHNPFSQFSLLKFLYTQGILGGDNQFVDIVSLTHREYASRLQFVYGDLR